MNILEMHFASCVQCGAEGPRSATPDGAQWKARDAGWAEEKGITRCPECRREQKQERAGA